MKEALFYEKRGDGSVRCTLCPHYCKIADGDFGICGVRQNRGGTLYAMSYEKAIATYKKLSLKVPEKSTYFADQNRELEKKVN